MGKSSKGVYDPMVKVTIEYPGQPPLIFTGFHATYCDQVGLAKVEGGPPEPNGQEIVTIHLWKGCESYEDLHSEVDHGSSEVSDADR